MSRLLKNYPNKITQAYGNGHGGIDLVGSKDGASVTTMLLAHSDGIVVATQTGRANNKGSKGNESYGNYIKIKHDNGYYTLYAHMKEVYVSVGDEIDKGAQIGYMGNTGNSYGAHLHFEVRNQADKIIDPTPYLEADLPTANNGQKPDIIYAVKVATNGWLPEVKNTEDYAGIENKPAVGIIIKLSDGTPIRYRVHLTNGAWLPWVTGYDKKDYYNGYAGDDKTPIDAVEIKCDKYTIKYKVSSIQSGTSYYATVSDDTTSGSESYAGIFGKPIDKIMAWVDN